MVQDRVLTEGELLVMLAIKRRLRDAYGVAIRDEIQEKAGRRMTFGVIYTHLARLERDGLLQSEEAAPTPERGGRAKRYFKLTGKGEGVLRATLSSIDQLRDTVFNGAAPGLALGRMLTAAYERTMAILVVKTA